MENCTNSEMTDMVLCYGSADGVSLRVQVLYRETFPVSRVLYSQTFLETFLRDNGTFRSRSVARDQKRTPRVLDFEQQILETVEENPATRPGQLVREAIRVIQWYFTSMATKRFHLPAKLL
jgi:hypothetical protein